MWKTIIKLFLLFILECHLLHLHSYFSVRLVVSNALRLLSNIEKIVLNRAFKIAILCHSLTVFVFAGVCKIFVLIIENTRPVYRPKVRKVWLGFSFRRFVSLWLINQFGGSILLQQRKKMRKLPASLLNPIRRILHLPKPFLLGLNHREINRVYIEFSFLYFSYICRVFSDFVVWVTSTFFR